MIICCHLRLDQQWLQWQRIVGLILDVLKTGHNVDKWSVRLIQWCYVVQNNKISIILETIFDQKQSKITLFADKVKKSVHIAFK